MALQRNRLLGHGGHALMGEAKDLPHLLRGGDPVADDMGTHTSFIGLIWDGRSVPQRHFPVLSTTRFPEALGQMHQRTLAD